ncbi:MAG TPA: hypothetical protein VN937_28955 [Blastocatellia bacterium]|nr:hypothetical protein [Blastocatellia bacterium]
MPEQPYAQNSGTGSIQRSAVAAERDRLAIDLQDRIDRLNEQARIFIPLIALCLIFAIPIWSKSLVRFVLLLVNPFVLLPLAFCVIHLLLAWRGIAKVRARIRECERNAANDM